MTAATPDTFIMGHTLVMFEPVHYRWAGRMIETWAGLYAEYLVNAHGGAAD